MIGKLILPKFLLLNLFTSIRQVAALFSIVDRSAVSTRSMEYCSLI